MNTEKGKAKKYGNVYGFFDNYKTFELWLSNYFENYPEVEEIFPYPISIGNLSASVYSVIKISMLYKSIKQILYKYENRSN